MSDQGTPPTDERKNIIHIPHGLTLHINPGSGPMLEASVPHATLNAASFMLDVAALLASGDEDAPPLQAPDILDHLNVERDASLDYGEGRYAYHLRWTGAPTPRECVVQMPGLPLAQVRYLRGAGMDPWQFPRLYVDGSSWLWCFAVSQARHALLGTHEEEHA